MAGSSSVDVDLAPLLLELPQLVGRDAPDNSIILQSSERNEGVGTEQSAQITSTRSLISISARVIEGFTEGRQQGVRQRYVIWRELSNI